AAVTNEIVLKGKRAQLHFEVTPGEPFTVRNMDVDITDPNLAQLYHEDARRFTYVRPGVRYDADSLVGERERIYHGMRQRGYYDYLRQYMRVDVDTNLRSNQADLKLIVDNPVAEKAHTQYRIDSSFVT